VSDGDVFFENGARVCAHSFNCTPRLSICVLLTHLFLFFYSFFFSVNFIVFDFVQAGCPPVFERRLH